MNTIPIRKTFNSNKPNDEKMPLVQVCLRRNKRQQWKRLQDKGNMQVNQPISISYHVCLPFCSGIPGRIVMPEKIFKSD